MPWTSDDVDKFKKGLSAEGKKKWTSTANSVLSDCMKKGGSEKECAGKAVRIANGTANNENMYSIYINKQEKGYKVKEASHQGKKHIIVPVTMMVEGVHYGSHGPLLHYINELGKYPDSWNGIPVVVNHPEKDGMNISANDPDIIDTQTVGRIYNTHVKSKKLVAEAWLDMEKLENIFPEVLMAVNGGELLEVSLGMFTDDERVSGEWDGEIYEGIAKNHRPDHLALLPCSVGACSVFDGCGLGVNNKEGGNDVNKDEKTPEVLDDGVLKLHDNNDKTWEIVTNDMVIAEGSGFIRTKLNNINKEKEVTTMAENAKCAPCEKKVNELIANSQGKFTEEDREWLMTLDENRLDKLTPAVITKEVEVNVLSEDDKKIIATYKQQQKEKREKLIQTIITNAKDIWTAEVLNEMDDDKLERLSRSIKREDVTDYSANAPSFNASNVTAKVEPLYPAGFKITKK